MTIAFPRWNEATFKSKRRPGTLIAPARDLKKQLAVAPRHPHLLAKVRVDAKDWTEDLDKAAEERSGPRTVLAHMIRQCW